MTAAPNDQARNQDSVGRSRRRAHELPVLRWLQIGAAAAGVGVGVAMVGAPAALADSGNESGSASSDSGANGAQAGGPSAASGHSPKRKTPQLGSLARSNDSRVGSPQDGTEPQGPLNTAASSGAGATPDRSDGLQDSSPSNSSASRTAPANRPSSASPISAGQLTVFGLPGATDEAPEVLSFSTAGVKAADTFTRAGRSGNQQVAPFAGLFGSPTRTSDPAEVPPASAIASLRISTGTLTGSPLIDLLNRLAAPFQALSEGGLLLLRRQRHPIPTTTPTPTGVGTVQAGNAFGPTVSYDPAQNSQTGAVISGKLVIDAAGGFSLSNGSGPVPLASGRRVLTSGVTSSPRGGQFPVTPSKGAVVVHADGTFTYTADPGFAHNGGGVDRFVITVRDGNGRAISIPITVTVSPTNTAPTPATPTANQPDPSTGVVTGRIPVTDSDGDAPTFSTSGTSAKGGSVTIDAESGDYTYTPTPEARHGASRDEAPAEDLTDSFEATVDDGYGGRTIVPVTVVVAPSNSTPTSGTPQVGDPDPHTGVIHGAVPVIDSDGDAPTFSSPGTTAKGGTVTVDPDTGEFVYRPSDAARHAASRNGAPADDLTDTFDVVIDDGYGGTTTVTVTAAVTPVNATPSPGTPVFGDPDPITGTVPGSVPVLDQDSDAPTFSSPGTTTKGGKVTVDPETGEFVYTPSDEARHAASRNGAPAEDLTDTFDVTVDDGYGGTTTVTVTVAVAPANAAPTAGTPTMDDPDTDTGVVNGALPILDADGDAPHFSTPGTTAKGGTVTVDPLTGQFSYTPTDVARHAAANPSAAPEDLTDTFDLVVDDGFGGTITVTVTVLVGQANSAPAPGASAASSPNPNTGVIDGGFPVVDDDGDTPTFSTSGVSVKGGTVTVDANTGDFVYTPSTEARHAAAHLGATHEELTDSFDIVVDDGYGGRTTVTITVALGPLNSDPSVGIPVLNGPGGDTGVITGALPVVDDDLDIPTFSTDGSTVKGGTVTIDPETGEFTYTPSDASRRLAARQQTPFEDSFAVTVDDGHGGIVVAQVTVTIAPGATNNMAPTAGVPNVDEPDSDTGVTSGSLPTTDEDGDTPSYSTPGTSTLGGSVTVDPVTGTFVYTPTETARRAAARQLTPLEDTFDVIVEDAFGGHTTVTVSVIVAPSDISNTDPVPGTPSLGSPESDTGMIGGALPVTDADGDIPTFSTPGTSAKGGTVTIDPETGQFLYTPSSEARHAAARPGASADDLVDTFDITVDDGFGGVVTVPVTVSVAPFNSAPTVGAPVLDAVFPGGGVVTGVVPFTDADGDTPAFSVVGGVTAKGGTITVDPDTGAFTYTPTAQARHAAAVAGAPAENLTDTFDIVVDDGFGGRATVTVTVAIDGANAAPVAGAPVVGAPDPDTGIVVGSIPATDPDGDAATFVLASAPGKGTVVLNPATGVFSYTPSAAARHAAAAPGAALADLKDSFNVTIDDSSGAITTITVTVDVGAANAAPTATAQVGVTASDGTVTGTVTGSDTDTGDTLAFTTAPTSTKGGTVSIDPDTGEFTYTPTATARHAASATGALLADLVDTFTVTVADNYGGTTTFEVTVPITSANTAPTVTPVASGMDALGVVTGAIIGADPDADTLTFSAPTSTAKGGTITIDADTGDFVYTADDDARHDAAALGASAADLIDTFTVTVTDGHGGLTAVTVRMVLAPVNSPPELDMVLGANDPVSGAIVLTTTPTDPDGDPVTVTITQMPSRGGLIDNGDGTYTYTPTAAARSAAAAADPLPNDVIDAFTLTVDDGHGGITEVPITVTITPANTPPTLTVTTGSPNPVSGATAISPVGADADNQSVTVAVGTGPTRGTLTPNGDGTYTYTPDPSARHAAAAYGAPAEDQVDTFTLVVSDGHGSTVTVTVPVSIAPANANPGGTANPGTPNAGTGLLTGTVTVGDTDGDTLTYSGPANTGRGTVTINPTTGAFTYTPNATARHDASANGAGIPLTTDSFNITVTDGHGGRATIPVTVTIAPANTNPTAAPTSATPNADTGQVTGSVAAHDPDNDSVRYGVTTSPGKGVVSLDPVTGEFTYTPTAIARHNAAAVGASTTDTFTVSLDDGHGGVVNVPVIVTIAPANTAPTATLSVVTFPNGDFTNGLTGWTAVNGRVKLNGGSTVAGWPTPTDPTKAPDGGTEATSVSGGTYTTTVSGGRAVMVSDVSGVANTPTGKGGVVHGPVLVSNNAIQIFSGATVQFDWEASGGDDAYDVLGYLVNVDTGATSIMLNATGADEDAIQPVTTVNFAVTQTGNYKFVFVSGTWDETKGKAAGARLSIDNIKVLNNTTSEGVIPATSPSGVINGTVIGADTDPGDALAYSVSPTSAQGGTVTIDSASGAFIYTPTATARHNAAADGAGGIDSFAITVDDGHGGITTVPVRITITPANSLPTATANPGTPNLASGVVTGTLTRADADSDALTFTTSGTSASGGTVSVDSATGAFTYTPTADARHKASTVGASSALKTDTFTISVNDGHGGVINVPVTVTVAPANTAPSATPTPGSPNSSSGVINGTFTNTDADGDSLTYTVTGQPTKGTLSVTNTTGAFTYTPTAAARHDAATTGAAPSVTTDTFTVTVNDGHGGTTAIPVTVIISPTNTAPTATATSSTPNATTNVVTGTVKGVDGNKDTLTYITSGTSEKGGTVTLNSSTGAFTYTPSDAARHNASTIGAGPPLTTDSFTIITDDGHGGTTPTTITVSLLPTNTAPTATTTVGNPDSGTGNVTGTINGVDSNNDALRYSAPTTTTKGTVVLDSATGAFVYTPTATARHNASAVGASPALSTDSFTVTMTDGHGGSVQVPVTVTIGAANAAPTATATVGAPKANTGVVIGSVTSNDTDGDARTFSLTGQAGKGTVTVDAASGAFTYVPSITARLNAAATGAGPSLTTDTFTIAVNDGHGGTTAVPVTVDIKPLATAPISAPYVVSGGAATAAGSTWVIADVPVGLVLKKVTFTGVTVWNGQLRLDVSNLFTNVTLFDGEIQMPHGAANATVVNFVDGAPKVIRGLQSNGTYSALDGPAALASLDIPTGPTQWTISLNGVSLSGFSGYTLTFDYP